MIHIGRKPAFLKSLAGALLLCLASAMPARAEKLVAALSSTRAEITSDYTGSAITVFGTIERDAQTVPRVGAYDIVITVRGPRQTLTVRERKRFGLIWINREQQKFEQVPAYISVLSSRPLAEITSDALLSRFKIGLNAIITSRDISGYFGPHDDPRFRKALLRLREKNNHFSEDEAGVSFLTPSLFSASVDVPATAPPGDYDVEVALFVDNTLLDRYFANFELIKSGFEQQVGDIAKDHSLVYGLATAALALFFGWLANILFRRD